MKWVKYAVKTLIYKSLGPHVPTHPHLGQLSQIYIFLGGLGWGPSLMLIFRKEFLYIEADIPYICRERREQRSCNFLPECKKIPEEQGNYCLYRRSECIILLLQFLPLSVF